MNRHSLPPDVTAGTQTAAVQAHCRRVAAAAGQLSHRLKWSADRQRALRQAACVHHRLAISPDSRVLNRMILDLWGLPSSVETASLLELCSFFVQRWEFLPYEVRSFQEIVSELRFLAHDGFFDPSHVDGLSQVPSVSLAQVREIASGLPPFPAAALQGLRLAAVSDAAAGEVERIVGPAIRAWFDHPSLEGVWQHSIEIAQLAVRLANQSRRADAEEAFLAGLVHDVGRLALARLPSRSAARYASLIHQGCEPVFAETLLCGFDHGAAGREVVEFWNMPPRIVEAVAWHHMPERSRSPLTQLLYLAEYWSNSQEDLPSLARLRQALRALDLTAGALRGLDCARPLPE